MALTYDTHIGHWFQSIYSEINPYTYDEFIFFTKVQTQFSEESCFQQMMPQLDIHVQNTESASLCHITHKNWQNGSRI